VKEEIIAGLLVGTPSSFEAEEGEEDATPFFLCGENEAPAGTKSGASSPSLIRADMIGGSTR